MKKALIVSLCLLLGACTPSQITSSLETVVVASSAGIVAVLALETNQVIPPSVAEPILTYAMAINTAAAKAAKDEGDTSLTPIQRTAALVADFSGIAVPIVPEKYRAEVQAIITAISEAVKAFLAQAQTPTLLAALAGPGARERLSRGDRAELKRIGEKAEKGLAVMRETRKANKTMQGQRP